MTEEQDEQQTDLLKAIAKHNEAVAVALKDAEIALVQGRMQLNNAENSLSILKKVILEIIKKGD